MCNTKRQMLFIDPAKTRQWIPPGHTSVRSYEMVPDGDSVGAEIHLSVQMPGAKSDPEIHPKSDQTFYIVKGCMIFAGGGTQFLVNAGQAVYIPAGVEHATQNDSDTEVTCLVITAPPIR